MKVDSGIYMNEIVFLWFMHKIHFEFLIIGRVVYYNIENAIMVSNFSHFSRCQFLHL